MSASGEHRYRSCFVGGEWVPPLTGGVISVENPATEEIIAEVPQAAGPDVDRAVSAAQASLPD